MLIQIRAVNGCSSPRRPDRVVPTSGDHESRGGGQEMVMLKNVRLKNIFT